MVLVVKSVVVEIVFLVLVLRGRVMVDVKMPFLIVTGGRVVDTVVVTRSVSVRVIGAAVILK
jgi:hypothetical protein